MIGGYCGVCPMSLRLRSKRIDNPSAHQSSNGGNEKKKPPAEDRIGFGKERRFPTWPGRIVAGKDSKRVMLCEFEHPEKCDRPEPGNKSHQSGKKENAAQLSSHRDR